MQNPLFLISVPSFLISGVFLFHDDVFPFSSLWARLCLVGELEVEWGLVPSSIRDMACFYFTMVHRNFNFGGRWSFWVTLRDISWTIVSSMQAKVSSCTQQAVSYSYSGLQIRSQANN